MRRLFLGVDGGQTSTTVLVGDESGAIVGRGVGGPCSQAESLRDALVQASVAETSFEAACFGFSGGWADKEAWAKQLVPAKLYLFEHDAYVALLGATGGEPGVVTIAGTGSIAFGKNTAGKTARAGGWGHVFGDEGGAFDLVRQALRAALRREEGWGPATSLLPALLDATGARDANDLLHRFCTAEYPKDRVASFAAIVDQAAQSGDLVAREILVGAAQALATITMAVRRQLFELGENIPVAYIGGVFESAAVRERYRMLMELEEGNRVIAPVSEPAAGALKEAYRVAGEKKD